MLLAFSLTTLFVECLFCKVFFCASFVSEQGKLCRHFAPFFKNGVASYE